MSDFFYENKCQLESLWRRSKVPVPTKLKLISPGELSTIKTRNYCVDIKSITLSQLEKIKKDLTVVLTDENEKTQEHYFFEIFQKPPHTYIKLPIPYGNYVFGKPCKDMTIWKEKDQSFDERWKFEGTLRTDPPQKKVIDSTVRFLKTKMKSGMVVLPCGFGKCLAKGTRVSTKNKGIINVEQVQIGDVLYDENEKDTIVESVCNGFDQMYKIVPRVQWKIDWKDEMGETSLKNQCFHYFKNLKKDQHNLSMDSYTVNTDHILTLFPKNQEESCLIDIQVKQLYDQKNNDNFYLVQHVYNPCKDSNIQQKICFSKTDWIHFILEDSNESHCFKTTRSKDWCNQLFWVLDTKHVKHYKLMDLYEWMRIYGLVVVAHDFDIWTIHENKPNRNKKFYAWDFQLQKIETQEPYFGFTLSQSRRFTLSTGHITHNTMCSFHIAKEMRCKTLFLAANIDLIYQPIDRLRHFFPSVKYGIVHADRMEYMDKDIVFATFQTIRSRKLEFKKKHPSFFDCFELIIIDEAHHIAAQTYFEVLHHFNSLYRIGLTATPNRHDDTHKMLFYTLGPICVQVFRKIDTLPVKSVTCSTSNSENTTLCFKSEVPKITVLDYENEKLEKIEITTKMMKRYQEDICFRQLSKDYKRSNHIANEWWTIISKNQNEQRRCICLSHRLEHHASLIGSFTVCVIKKTMTEFEVNACCVVRIIHYNRKKKIIDREPILRIMKTDGTLYEKSMDCQNLFNLHFGYCNLTLSSIGGKTDIQTKDWIGVEIDFESDSSKNVKLGVFQGNLPKVARPTIKSFVFTNCNVIFMTYFLGKEGLDEDSLDTVIMASPAGKGSIVQSQGRALRKIYKKDVKWSRSDHHTIYVMDRYNAYFMRQSMNALRYFKSQGHIIQTKKIVEKIPLNDRTQLQEESENESDRE